MNFKILGIVAVFVTNSVSADKPIYSPIDIRKYSSIDIQIYEPTEDIIIYESIDIKIYYPTGQDSDNDGVNNEKDPFPNNSKEWLDTDHDGIGNNADKDDDNDGISDTLERANGLNPLNASDAQADLDHDGFSNAIEISVGTDIRSAKSKPTWAPVIMGDIMIFIPSK